MTADEDQCDLDGKDLSFSSLLAAHGRRRSERSVSYSSCSWSDVSIGSETLPRKPLSINPVISKGLLVVSIEPRGREVTYAEHYTSAQLMTLPPLCLAACRGRCTPVTLLLQHGAKANITVSQKRFVVVWKPLSLNEWMEKKERKRKGEKGVRALCIFGATGRQAAAALSRGVSTVS
jgi:hypothetical protein